MTADLANEGNAVGASAAAGAAPAVLANTIIEVWSLHLIPGISPDSQRDPRGQTGEHHRGSK